MANILVAASPAPGHVVPMLSVARHLSSIGHSIMFLSGTLFRDQAVALGIQYQAMIVKFNAEETAREQLGLPSQTAAFQDEINQVVQRTHDRLTQVLSKDGATRLEALIQAEKSR
jgi:UDP:flavonoid glycosyltransferase YjiC (YdhE family)